MGILLKFWMVKQEPTLLTSFFAMMGLLPLSSKFPRMPGNLPLLLRMGVALNKRATCFFLVRNRRAVI